MKRLFSKDNYLEELSTTWNLIVISDNENDFKYEYVTYERV